METHSSGLSQLGLLVQTALDETDDPSASMAAIARKALRIARIRGDWEIVWWLQLEMGTIKAQRDDDGLDDDGAGIRASAEAKEQLTPTEFERVAQAVTKRWIGGRKLDKDSFQRLGISDAEIRIATMRAQIERFEQAGLLRHPKTFLAVAELREQVSEMESLLARLRNEIGVYLGNVERQLVLGDVSEHVWERNRAYVDQSLARLAPQALEQFAAANRRRSEGDAEARSHALTSCRRVLKTLADTLYPASNTLVMGVDGKERRMTDDKFISRLCQFASERRRSSSSTLLLVQVRSLGERLDAVNALSSKGVHDQISAAEVDQCMIQTYLVVGDLLRIAESEQHADESVQGVAPLSA